MRYIIAVCLIITVSTATGHAQAQDRADSPEAAYLQSKLDQQLQGMRLECRRAFYGVLFYPKPIRDAVLELCQHPSLIARLNGAGANVEKLTADHDDATRQAAKTALQHPEILGILDRNLTLAGLVGNAFRDDRTVMLELVDRRAAEEQARRAAVLADWTERLEDNGGALDALGKAAAALSSKAADEPYDPASGLVLADQRIVVYDLPSAAFVLELTDNAADYHAAFDELAQHLRQDERFYGEYYGDAWTNVRSQIDRKRKTMGKPPKVTDASTGIQVEAGELTDKQQLEMATNTHKKNWSAERTKRSLSQQRRVNRRR